MSLSLLASIKAQNNDFIFRHSCQWQRDLPPVLSMISSPLQRLKEKCFWRWDIHKHRSKQEWLGLKRWRRRWRYPLRNCNAYRPVYKRHFSSSWCNSPYGQNRLSLHLRRYCSGRSQSRTRVLNMWHHCPHHSNHPHRTLFGKYHRCWHSLTWPKGSAKLQ